MSRARWSPKSADASNFLCAKALTEIKFKVMFYTSVCQEFCPRRGRGWSTSGRYASYWNAFLFANVIQNSYDITLQGNTPLYSAHGHMDKECKLTTRFWITFTMYHSRMPWCIHCRFFQLSSSWDILPFLPCKYLLCFQSHCKRRMYHQFEMG